MATSKTRPARIEFTERNGNYYGRLNADDYEVAMDDTIRVKAAPYSPFYRISFSGPAYAPVQVCLQGGLPGGRRYTGFATIGEAKRHAQKWAGRRFRCPLAPGEKSKRVKVETSWQEEDRDYCLALSLVPGDDWTDHKGRVVGRFVGLDSAGVIHVAYNDKDDFDDKRIAFLKQHIECR